MNNIFTNPSLINERFGKAFDEAKFVLSIRRYDTAGGKPDPRWTMVVVADHDDQGFERNLVEGGLTAMEILCVRDAYRMGHDYHQIGWVDFPEDLKNYVMYNLLPIEWHGSDDTFVGERVYAMSRTATVEMPYDCWEDPKWLREHGYADIADDIEETAAKKAAEEAELQRLKEAAATEEAKAKAEGFSSTPLDTV